MRKHFYNDILIIAVIFVIVALFFNSCKTKKEILETHIESRDSVCNVKESQNIVLLHEDSASSSERLVFDQVDTGKICIVKFNDIEIRDTAKGTVTRDKSVVIYKKQNAGHTSMDHIETSCSISTDSTQAEMDSTVSMEQRIDHMDQTQQKTERKWNTYHTFLFWVIIALCLSAGIVESNRKK